MIHPDLEKLYSYDEYKTPYIDYKKAPTPELVAHMEENYNINTDCSKACVTCQIVQISKYDDASNWNVRAKSATIFDSSTLKNQIGSLRKYQRVTLLERNSSVAKVSATIHSGICLTDETHPIFYSEDRTLIKEAQCAICDGGYTIKTEKIEGWLPFKAITAFRVKCNFFPEEYTLPSVVKNSLTPEEQDVALTALDPVRWANKVLGIELREHQELDARCTAKHTVRRWGRRAGKSFSECYKILRYCLTEVIDNGFDAQGKAVKRGPIVIIASPFLSQISELFGELEKMIARNPDIRIGRSVKTPFHQIELEGTEGIAGAVIKGFTTGSQSKSEGTVLRGQSADLILIDEADAMPEDDIVKAIQPIQITNANVQLMASSTPMGKQEWFWKQSVGTPHMRETYFPSTVLDHWDQVRDEIEQEGLSDTRFSQEYLAQFIAQVEGLYQPHFVAEAELPYEYGQPGAFKWGGQEYNLSTRNDGWIYSIGVDWNTNAGVEIVVVGMPKNTIEWWVVEAVNISKQNYQQHVAMQKIVDLNAKWAPKFVYVDKGYGNTQFEALQAFSEEAKYSRPGSEDARLSGRLKSYDFGSKVEFRNPATKQISREPAKPFLVENSIRQFEQYRVRFSYKDYTLHKQLLNYLREGFTPSGIPKYGMNDIKMGDHRLDALNLALIAYILEMSDFSVRSAMATRIAHSGGFGSTRTKTTVPLGEKNWIEFTNTLPDGVGVPGRLRVRHEPGYVEMKEQEIANRRQASRTSELDGSGSDSSDGSLRLGFGSDTEYKYTNKKLPGSRIARIGNAKPKKRSF